MSTGDGKGKFLAGGIPNDLLTLYGGVIYNSLSLGIMIKTMYDVNS